MKLPSECQTKDAIHKAAEATGWHDEAALIDLACEILSQSMGNPPEDYERVIRQAFDRDFKIWGAC